MDIDIKQELIDLEKFYQPPDGRRTNLNGFILLADILSKHLKVIYERLDYLELNLCRFLNQD